MSAARKVLRLANRAAAIALGFSPAGGHGCGPKCRHAELYSEVTRAEADQHVWSLPGLAARPGGPMLMATATLVATEGAKQRKLEATVVTDIVWASAKPADDLEHVHAQAAPGRIELTFFHRTRNPAEAISAAGEICLRALNSSPSLAHWRIIAAPQLPDALPGSGPLPA
ncbi:MULTISPECIES: hypothetical protein [unclassified Streptomyces]|uniref:hypothetical protein n=1 Tax=unclassified Streptomyces TaxID=2593676 RepID=UPI002365C3E4|nr:MULTISPECIES: hypothetical protein [unclassified Streptomyces]MDF3139964.1 hypothetical protein [Streptomyces sp. T21Q-yed]WDF39896.1 hypothetical protein PBV52_25420 [Streptomyces sp. T12]